MEKTVAERRRALGRGLDSLLPGPRAVPVAPRVPDAAEPAGTQAGSEPAGARQTAAGPAGEKPEAERASELAQAGGIAGTSVAVPAIGRRPWQGDA